MTTSARSRHRKAASCYHLFSTGDGEARSKLTVHAAPEPASPLSDVAPDHHGARSRSPAPSISALDPLAVAGHPHP